MRYGFGQEKVNVVCFSPARIGVQPSFRELSLRHSLQCENHTISSIVDQTHIPLTRQKRKKEFFFSKLLFLYFNVGP